MAEVDVLGVHEPSLPVGGVAIADCLGPKDVHGTDEPVHVGRIRVRRVAVDPPPCPEPPPKEDRGNDRADQGQRYRGEPVGTVLERPVDVRQPWCDEADVRSCKEPFDECAQRTGRGLGVGVECNEDTGFGVGQSLVHSGGVATIVKVAQKSNTGVALYDRHALILRGVVDNYYVSV